MRETLCLIAGARNEAAALPAFFKHHAWADEILVMDSFSTDDTAAVCRAYGRKCHQAHMAGNANQRHNLALTLTDCDWIFLIDPDEFITEKLKSEILGFLEHGSEAAAFEMPRINYFMDRPMRHGGWSGNGLKIFRRERVRFEGESYHEKPMINGKIGCLSGEILHYPNPNIHWILQKFNYISEFDLNSYYEQYGVLTEKAFRRLLWSKPLKNFWKSYIKKKGYRDGLHGLIYAAMILAFDVIRICKYGERYLIQNPQRVPPEQLPDPWEHRCSREA